MIVVIEQFQSPQLVGGNKPPNFAAVIIIESMQDTIIGTGINDGFAIVGGWIAIRIRIVHHRRLGMNDIAEPCPVHRIEQIGSFRACRHPQILVGDVGI